MKKCILTFGLLGLLLPTAWTQSTELIRQNARRTMEALNKRDYQEFTSLLSPQCIDYQAPAPVKGSEAVTRSIRGFLAAFPDYTIEISDIAVSGNKAYVFNTFRGTQTGPLMQLPPTGKKVAWSDVDILEFDGEGKIVAHWVNNPTAVLDQLGYHAFSNPATQVVMAAYERFGKGDLQGFLGHLTDEVQWDVLDNPIRELGRQYTGREQVQRHLSNLMNSITISKFQPVRFFAEGEDVTVFLDVNYTTLSDNSTYECRLIHHIQVREGKVAYFKEYSDRPRAVTVASK